MKRLEWMSYQRALCSHSMNLHVYPAWAVCDWPAHVRARVCVCLVLDFSVANPRAGLGGPSGDIFAADITSPERPLIRSQSFHNSPGKWPPAPRRGHEEASHCLLFQNTEE